MADKLLKKKPRKVAPKKAPAEAPKKYVLVGTYKEKQLAWIKKHGVYNYPVKDGDEFDAKAFAAIKELWLYAGVKGKRNAFEAEFVGKMTKAEFIAANPTYAKLGPSRSKEYYVFKTKFLEYGPRLENPVVIVRTADFGGRSQRVKKAIEQFKADGEFAPLEHYLPSDLSKVPRNRLRVCEAAAEWKYIMSLPVFGNALYRDSLAHDNNFTKGDVEPVRQWRCVSMFAGAGGCSLGAKNAGVDIIGAYEFADTAIATYERNFGTGSCSKEDLSTCDFSVLRDRLGLCRGELDLMIGGPPCQGFTTAGSRRTGDPRNNLVGNYFNALDSFYPRWFMMENVEGILTTANGWFIIECIRAAARIGYTLFLKKVYMQEYGISQRRKRVLLVGNREGKEFYFPQPQHVATGGIFRHGTATLRDVIGDIENCDIPEIGHVRHQEKGIRFERIHALKEGQTMRDLPARLQHESYGRRAARRVCDGTPSEKRGGAPVGLKRLIYDEPSLTITSAALSEFVHPVQDRMLTVRECARIQSFPDDFLFCGTVPQQMLQIGNAIPPRFAELMVNRIVLSDESQAGVYGSGLIRFDLTKANAQSPALEKTSKALRNLMPGNFRQMTLEL